MKNYMKFFELFFGVILLTPSLLCAIYFLLFPTDLSRLIKLTEIQGTINSNLFIFYGIMAIAGAYLIKDSQEKK